MYSQLFRNNLPYISSRFIIRVILLLILFSWFGFYSKLFFTGETGFLYPFAERCFSLICHQEDSKSFFFYGSTMLVCARCTGLYTGALLASLLFLFRMKLNLPSVKILFLSAAPLLIDVIMCSAGLYSYNKIISLLTGLLLGSVLFIFILAAIENNILNND